MEWERKEIHRLNLLVKYSYEKVNTRVLGINVSEKSGSFPPSFFWLLSLLRSRSTFLALYEVYAFFSIVKKNSNTIQNVLRFHVFESYVQWS